MNGGKHYLASKIISLFPKRYLTYCEPYFGGGSVLLGLNPNGHSEVVNDLDGELMNFWEHIRNEHHLKLLKENLERVPFSESVFGWAVDGDRWMLTKDSPLCGALNFFILSRQSLAGRKSSFAPISTTRTRRGMNEQVSGWLTAIEGLPDVHARLKRVLILNRPAEDVIRCMDNKQTLFYIDAPYIHSTRMSDKEYGKFEMNDEQHKELVADLLEVKGKVAVSMYHHPIYDVLANKHKWKLAEFAIANSAAGGKSKRRMTECLWMNY